MERQDATQHCQTFDGDFPLNPITPIQRMASRQGQSDCALTQGRPVAAESRVVESSSDQTWTEFCGSLNRNAFLLAESGFAELEQS